MQALAEWIVGEDLDGRWYLIHTTEPRFVCEVFDADDEEAILAPFSFAGGEYQLANFVWYDEVPPKKKLRSLLSAGCRVLAEYDQASENLQAAETLGQRLRTLRENLKLSRADLARELFLQQNFQVDPQTIYRWEVGVNLPNEATLEELADFFGVSVAWLRYGGSMVRYGYKLSHFRDWPSGVHDVRYAHYEHPWLVIHHESGTIQGCWTKKEAEALWKSLGGTGKAKK